MRYIYIHNISKACGKSCVVVSHTALHSPHRPHVPSVKPQAFFLQYEIYLMSFRPVSTNIISQNNIITYNLCMIQLWQFMNILWSVSNLSLLSYLICGPLVYVPDARIPQKVKVCKVPNNSGNHKHISSHLREVGTTPYLYVLTMWFNISEHASWCHYIITYTYTWHTIT